MRTPNQEHFNGTEFHRIGRLGGRKTRPGLGVPAALAAIIGLLIMPPKSPREFVARIVCTVVSSFLFGPMFAIAALSWRPSLIEAAVWMAERSGTGEESLLAMFYVLGPCMLPRACRPGGCWARICVGCRACGSRGVVVAG